MCRSARACAFALLLPTNRTEHPTQSWECQETRPTPTTREVGRGPNGLQSWPSRTPQSLTHALSHSHVFEHALALASAQVVRWRGQAHPRAFNLCSSAWKRSRSWLAANSAERQQQQQHKQFTACPTGYRWWHCLASATNSSSPTCPSTPSLTPCRCDSPLPPSYTLPHSAHPLRRHAASLSEARALSARMPWSAWRYAQHGQAALCALAPPAHAQLAPPAHAQHTSS